MRLAWLLTLSGSGTSGGRMAGKVCGVNACRCSRSIHVVHVMAIQDHSDCVVPRNRNRTELVWKFVVPIDYTCANRWVVYLTSVSILVLISLSLSFSLPSSLPPSLPPSFPPSLPPSLYTSQTLSLQTQDSNYRVKGAAMHSP